jgi:hypothetical protein
MVRISATGISGEMQNDNHKKIAKLRISSEFSLRRSDNGINPISFAGEALRLNDEVKFKFELHARKQE